MAESRSRVSDMKFISILILLVVLNFFSPVFGESGGTDGDSEPCHIDMTTFLPAPYSNMTNMICKPVWNSFVLRFFQSEDHILTIVLSAVYTTGWVGMGFSKDGMMVGSSAMVGWIGKDGRAHIKRYFLKGRTASEVIANKGELQETNVPPTVALHGPAIYLAFQLKFENHLTRQPIIFAFGTANPIHHRLSVHDDKTTVMFDFSTASAFQTFPAINKMKKNHGVLALIGWGILLPSGSIIARYYRHRDPLWFYLHTFIQFVGFLIGLAAVVAGKLLYDKMHAKVSTHRGIGIFVLALSILQVLAFFLRPNKDSKIRRYWNWYHSWVGRFALFFGALNIVIGIQVGGEGSPWKIAYGFLVGIIIITVIVLEALLCIRGSGKAVDIPAFQMNPMQ